MNEPLMLRDVRRIYRTEAGELPVLRGVDMAVHAGEIVALVAPSVCAPMCGVPMACGRLNNL